jgi:5'-3' exonuclease
MDLLKKKFVRISKNEIENVKNLIRVYGGTDYDAPGEADELCALLVIKNKVWACLSEDMDLFVYGCPRVLRYFSLIGHTAVLYNLDGILKELLMTQQEFKEICILSGTDYSLQLQDSQTDDIKKINLYEIMKLFQQFKKENDNQTFYDWILVNTNLIANTDELKKIINMFDLQLKEKLDLFNKIQIINGPKMQKDIEEIMKAEDFIFLPK